MDLVRSLDQHPSVDDALAASDVPPARWPAFRKALVGLEASEVIRAR